MSKDFKSLQELIDSKPSLVDYFYHDTLAPHTMVRGGLSPVPIEVTNWRDEQHAWRESAILFDQSHHMPEMIIKGPGAFSLLNRIGINSFLNFKPGMAKQFVACAPSGHIIGDCILFYLADGSFELVSGMTLHDWVEYQAIATRADVEIHRDPPTSLNPNGRERFRFGLDGPFAGDIFAEVVEGEVPELPFFRTASVRIAGCDVLALRHGMAGHKGVELAGAYADGPRVRDAIMAAGAKHGILRGGKLAYFSAVTESGWMAYPLPAIYTDEALRSFREWLPADCWEASSQLAGSFRSQNIEDYYNTPYELGYGRIVKFDHEFIGREALEEIARSPQRQKVTLVWDAEEVDRIHGSLTRPGVPFKYLGLPVGSYGFPQCDAVESLDGRLVGLSNYTGYSGNENKVLSLGMVDRSFADIGTELRLVWGEPGGGSRKPHVERHVLTSVRVTVAPVPYAETVRKLKRASVGTADVA